MTNIAHIVGICGATAMLAIIAFKLAERSFMEIVKRGRGFAFMFISGCLIATLSAQKPGPTPSIEGIRLNLVHYDAKGFDISWDYLETDPALLAGKHVRLRGWVSGMDYNIVFGDFPTSVTNYHCNAVLRGFPENWMAHDWEIRAEIEGLVSSIRFDENGGDE